MKGCVSIEITKVRLQYWPLLFPIEKFGGPPRFELGTSGTPSRRRPSFDSIESP
jgi:hypothetical protein